MSCTDMCRTRTHSCGSCEWCSLDVITINLDYLEYHPPWVFPDQHNSNVICLWQVVQCFPVWKHWDFYDLISVMTEQRGTNKHKDDVIELNHLDRYKYNNRTNSEGCSECDVEKGATGGIAGSYGDVILLYVCCRYAVGYSSTSYRIWQSIQWHIYDRWYMRI